MGKLTSIDLFSGVGGITLALEGIARPALYCEINSGCRAVLERNMREGRLPKAPIITDVRSLTRASTPKQVDLIAGGFPCFVAGTRVATDEGYKRIEEVEGHERLLTHRGRFRPIVNMQRKLHSGQLYTLRAKGRPDAIVCTEEHPFYVRRGRGVDADPEWVNAKDLTPGRHYVGLPVNGDITVPVFTADPAQPVRKVLDDPAHWWAMGYFLGAGRAPDDGGAAGRHRVVFEVHDDQAEDVLPRLELLVRLARAGGTGDDAAQYVASSKTWWNVLGMFEGPRGKLIPEWVQSAPAELLAHFLEGCVAAAGSSRLTAQGTPAWRIGAASYDVAAGLQRVAAKLGHAVDVGGPRGRDPYHVSCRPGGLRDRGSFVRDGYLWSELGSVTTADDGAERIVYNFEVADDNSYVVQNVASHNCIGFSNMGKREAFDNAQSSLFYHILRLIDEFKRPPFVFLENVPPIVTMGMPAVSKELSSRGYDLSYTVLPAYSVGAPQSRKRWFCLAVKRGTPAVQLRPGAFKPLVDWSREPVPRMCASTPNYMARMGMLGNSVVPECVRKAFVFLFTGGRTADPRAGTLTLARPAAAGGAKWAKPGFPVHGAVVAGVTYEIAPPKIVAKPNLNIVVDPKTYKGKPVQTVSLPPLAGPRVTPLWNTPRHGGNGCSHVVTERTMRDLATQIRFARCTPNDQRKLKINPEWGEWLMGYPRGHTAYESQKKMAAP
jgi:site-specific DNA-cytosine methylase